MAKRKGGLGLDQLGAGKEALFKITPPTPPPAQPADRSPTGRKRHRDYKGTPKKDYHHTSQMLGVRVPDELAEKVRQRAAENDQSVNAWLLALIEAALET